MKKLLIAALAALLMAACTTSTQHPSPDTRLAFDSLHVEIDSMAVALTLSVDYPSADTMLQHFLADYVANMMLVVEDGEGNIAKPDYNADLVDFLQRCAQQRWSELLADAEGAPTYAVVDNPDAVSNDVDAESEIPTLEELGDMGEAYLTIYNMTFRKVYEDSLYVSWQRDYDICAAGAPYVLFGTNGITVAKADATPLGHELLKDTDSDSFHQLLKEGLRQWVKNELELPADTDEDLARPLYGDSHNVNALRLPEQPPYLTDEGVALTYQSEELIASREPVVIVLPYDQVKPFLNIIVTK